MKHQAMRDTTNPKPPAVGESVRITETTSVECGESIFGDFYRALVDNETNGPRHENFQDAVNDALEMGKA